jgi:dTMP kinase
VIVCLEGPDGCGKGTQAELLVKRLNARLWKFPNKETVTGKLIYEHLDQTWTTEVLSLNPPAGMTDKKIDATVFQALQLANRMEVASDIFQAASKGNVVFDRYWPSGYAYGLADGLDGEYLINLHRWLPQPDLFLLLDIDADDSVRRRPERRDRYESQPGLMEEVLKNYHQLWAKFSPPRWVVIDARGSVELVSALIDKAIIDFRYKDGSI